MTNMPDPVAVPEHEPFEVQDPWLPHWTYLIKGMALLLISSLLTIASIIGIFWNWYMFPIAIPAIGLAFFSFWGAIIQLTGGALLADHEF
tara:strand:+ start:15509 stop:15778 length:270 start_codon:yes stop_codon:yes gene_type:complete